MWNESTNNQSLDDFMSVSLFVSFSIFFETKSDDFMKTGMLAIEHFRFSYHHFQIITLQNIAVRSWVYFFPNERRFLKHRRKISTKTTWKYGVLCNKLQPSVNTCELSYFCCNENSYEKFHHMKYTMIAMQFENLHNITLLQISVLHEIVKNEIINCNSHLSKNWAIRKWLLIISDLVISEDITKGSVVFTKFASIIGRYRQYSTWHKKKNILAVIVIYSQNG